MYVRRFPRPAVLFPRRFRRIRVCNDVGIRVLPPCWIFYAVLGTDRDQYTRADRFIIIIIIIIHVGGCGIYILYDFSPYVYIYMHYTWTTRPTVYTGCARTRSDFSGQRSAAPERCDDTVGVVFVWISRLTSIVQSAAIYYLSIDSRGIDRRLSLLFTMKTPLFLFLTKFNSVMNSKK